MAIYRFICERHEEPVITDIKQSMEQDIPESVPCSSCQEDARRHWMGLTFYAIVPGAHGGGPATR